MRLRSSLRKGAAGMRPEVGEKSMIKNESSWGCWDCWCIELCWVFGILEDLAPFRLL